MRVHLREKLTHFLFAKRSVTVAEEKIDAAPASHHVGDCGGDAGIVAHVGAVRLALDAERAALGRQRIERFRRADQDKLQIELTIDDAKAYTKPWTARLYYSLQRGWSLLEQYCEDNDTFQEVEKEETNKPAK